MVDIQIGVKFIHFRLATRKDQSYDGTGRKEGIRWEQRGMKFLLAAEFLRCSFSARGAVWFKLWCWAEESKCDLLSLRERRGYKRAWRDSLRRNEFPSFRRSFRATFRWSFLPRYRRAVNVSGLAEKRSAIAFAAALLSAITYYNLLHRVLSVAHCWISNVIFLFLKQCKCMWEL